MNITNTESYDYIFSLVNDGKLNFEDLDKVDKNELTSLLYREATTMERHEWLVESERLDNVYESISAALIRDDEDSSLDLMDTLRDILSESCSYKANKIFQFVIDGMDENNELCRQDSDYVLQKETFEDE